MGIHSVWLQLHSVITLRASCHYCWEVADIQLEPALLPHIHCKVTPPGPYKSFLHSYIDDTATAKILLNVLTKYIGHCDNSDAPRTWNKLRMMFQSEGHSTVAALCHQFHSMSYEPHLSMCTWITNVEDLAHHLESANSPMIPIDIINTMICQLPDSYSPLIVHFDTMLQHPNTSSNLNTLQYVIM